MLGFGIIKEVDKTLKRGRAHRRVGISKMTVNIQQ